MRILSCFLIATIFCFHLQASQEKLYEVRDVISNLGNTDATVVSETLKTLESYKYFEVYDKVVTIVETQLKSVNNNKKLNSFILSAAFESLNHFINTETSGKISDLIERYEAANSVGKLADQKGVQFINAAVSNLKSRMQNSPQYELTSMSSLVSEDASVKDKIASLKFGEVILEGTVGFLRDEALEKKAANEYIPTVGRDKEVMQTLEVLARIKGRNPVLVGPAGVGKTSIAVAIDEISFNNQLPKNRSFESLKDLTVIETTPAKISTLAKSNDSASQAAAIEMYVEAVSAAQKELKQPIAIFIDEVHTLEKAQVEALKRYLESQGNLKFIFASTSEEFNLAFKDNKAFLRRVKQVGVEELPNDRVKQILYDTWITKVERRHGVRFQEEVIDRVIEDSLKLLPNNGKVDGSIKILESIAIRNSTTADEAIKEIGKNELSEIVREYYSLPVDPNNFSEFFKFFNQVEAKLNEKVVGQERMNKDVLNAYSGLLQSRNKNVASVYIVGTTGTGKTYLGQSLSEIVLNNRGAFFEINGNELSKGGFEGNSLFGAPNGIESSQKTSGQFIEWIDDPGRGGKGGIVLINEIEKMHPDHLQRIMELQDRGIITGGDGKVRHVKNLLFIMTSNRSVDMIFPKSWESWTESEMRNFLGKMTSDSLKEMVDHKSSGNYGDQGKLPPEIKNRIDIFTVAAPLNKTSAEHIAVNYLNEIVSRFKYDTGIELRIDKEVIEILVNHNYNSEYGARPIIRSMERILTDIKLAIAEHVVDRGEDIKVDITYQDQKFVVSNNETELTKIEAPAKPVTDPLQDKSILNIIENLHKNMSNKIFGQNEMIQKISEAVISHIGDSQERQRAMSLFLIGSTGTGKSETAKALAETLYGSSNRTGFINLGTIRFEGDFNKVFNPPPGYVSGDKAGQFERYLISNPEGGVLLFDEASNMGGNNKALKDELFKEMYEVTDERRWESTATGKVYDLSKHVFIFTGNDGENLFKGVAADDIRLTIWDQSRKQSTLHKLLLESGVPEAFLGRMLDVILMKPLTREVVAEHIAPKFLSPIHEKLKEQEIKINYDKEFENTLGRVFFTHDKGARSLRSVIESQLTSTIVKARIKLMSHQLTDASIHLEIKDNMPNKPFIEDVTNYERKVEIVANIKNNKGKVIDIVSVEVTDFADVIHLQSKEQAKLTSFHEAGHAVVNNPKYTNQKLAFITIVGRGNYLGYARYNPMPGSPSVTQNSVLHRVAGLLAGSISQQMAGFEADAGMRQDVQMARAIIKSAITEYGIFPEFISELPMASSNAQQSFRLSPQMLQKSEELFKQATEIAINELSEKWEYVEKIVDRLMKNGEISQQQFEKIMKTKYKKASPKLENVNQTRAFFKRMSVETKKPAGKCISLFQ